MNEPSEPFQLERHQGLARISFLTRRRTIAQLTPPTTQVGCSRGGRWNRLAKDSRFSTSVGERIGTSTCRAARYRPKAALNAGYSGESLGGGVSQVAAMISYCLSDRLVDRTLIILQVVPLDLKDVRSVSPGCAPRLLVRLT